MVPSKVFFTRGKGVHLEKLFSFELALRDAGITPYNLIPVSSILPPHCKIIDKEQGVEELPCGDLVHLVLSRNSTNESNKELTASVGRAIPARNNHYGYLSEHHAFGQSEKESGDYAEDLAASMLATILDVEFDPEAAYDDRKKVYMMSGKIVETDAITQYAVSQEGMWTTVIAAAVFVP